jgi:hypothetical protein
MALKINRVWKKWGVELRCQYRRTAVLGWGNHSFETAFEKATLQIGRLKEDMKPNPHQHHHAIGPPPLVDVGYVTADVFMDLDGSSWLTRGVRFLTVLPDGTPVAHHMNHNRSIYVAVARIKRDGEAYVSLSPYRYDTQPTSQKHYLRAREALDELAGYIKEQVVFWSAFRHTA